MVLHLHRAPRTDLLADALGELLATPPEDPFAPELVLVPAKGVERWLSQRLSHRLGAGPAGDGVCAGVEFRHPASLVAEVLGTRDEDPWSADALVWPLLGALDACLDEPWARVLALHLGHGAAGEEADLRRGRRLAVARRLAGLFASYAAQRPAVLADWAGGGAGDGCGDPVPDDLAWQPELWRRVAARVDEPPPHERQATAVARLRAEPGSFDLPGRLSLFGHTRLARAELELLEALGSGREVHLWLPHPSTVLWTSLAAGVAAGPVVRRSDESHRLVEHPLLATLGRDVRELQRALAGLDLADDGAAAGASGGTTAEPAPTLLGWLQHDLRAGALPSAGGRAARVLAVADRSVQVHACHGPARQVDVLREVLLGLLADDPTLEPRDVLVMCPDIETYAPLVQAGFGLGEVVGTDGHPAHRLRVSLADRSPVATNPLLAVVERLLELAGGRAEAATVLDLAHAEPVRRRFGLRDDDLTQVADWVRTAGVRWAFDASHRADVGLDAYVAGTWRFGLDRLLLGVAMSDDSGAWLDTTLPLDDVGSGQVDLAGRLAEYVARLQQVTDALVGEHPLTHWLDTLLDGVTVLTAVGSADAWQVGQLQRELGRLREAAQAAGATAGGATPDADPVLRLSDVRALLRDRLAARPTRSSFRTGSLTVCTMTPMRSVPHRVVCLVGLDDGAFPRQRVVDGDDLLAREPVTGERDLRSEDRQLLLDAVLAATETLVVTYTGAGEYSGQPRPPAVPLGELLDTLDLTAVTAPSTARGGDGRDAGEGGSGGGSVAAAVTVHHPLQPFDARNLAPGALVPARPFSFDRAALAGARAAAGRRTPPVPFLAGPLAAPAGSADGPPADTVALDDLLAFYRDPARGLLRQRLDVGLPVDDEPVPSELPVEVDNLEQWAVGERVLDDLLRGRDVETVKQREWRRGVLPPGQLGWRVLRDIVQQAQPIAEEGRRLRTLPPRAVDVDVDLGDGRRLVGTVPGLHGDRLVSCSYSRLGASARLQSWVRLLALTAHDDDRSWSALTLGRPGSARSADPVGQSQLGPLDHRALGVLRELVRLRDRGLCEALPLPLKSSFTYASLRRTRANTAEALRKAGWDWDGGRFPGERDGAAQLRVWGAGAPLPGAGPVPPGEEHDGETTRFGALALRVWSPLLEAERGSW